MDPKYLSRIENGHSGVSRELLLRIGRELGKGLDYFYIDNPELEAAYALDAEFAQKWKQCNKAQKLTILNITEAGGLYKIQVGAYSQKSNADAQLAKVKAAGFDAFITTNSGSVVSSAPSIRVGSNVRVRSGAKTYNGVSLASFVYSRVHQVSQINGDRAVISYNGTVVAAVHTEDLILVS